MLSGVVTNRYTQGLYSFAQAHGAVAAVDESMQTLAQVLSEHSDFEALLHHPLITSEQKTAAVKAVFGDVLDPLVIRFLHILFDRKRGAYVRAVAVRFHELTEAAKGELAIEVESARPLDDAGAKALADQISQTLNRPVITHVTVNQDLIGGYRLRLGNRVLDATIRGALKQFAEKLTATGVGSADA